MIDKNERNGIDEDSTLFGAPNAPETLEKRRKRNAQKKQRTTIIVLSVCVAVALLAYFFVLKPIIARVEDEPDEEIRLLDGEVLATGNRILMYEHYEREDIEKIDIQNEYGEFGFYYDKEYDEFFVSGHPNAPYDTELFSSLVVSVGYTVVSERVHEDCDDMSEYGLDASQSPASVTLTARTGESYTVYLGNVTASETGYYARVEGRDAVYVIGADIGSTVLVPLESLITPQLTLPLETNAYYMIENFAIMDGEDARVFITRLSEEEQTAAAMQTVYAMLAPGNYSVHTSNYTAVLQQLGDFSGSRTVKLAPDEATLAKYGLLEPAHAVYFTYDGMEQMVVFSEKNEDGNYYAYSVLFGLIAEVRGDSAEWIEWDLIKWVDFPIFLMNINDVKTVTVEGENGTRVFELDAVEKALDVTESISGFKPDPENFRLFYRVLLSVYVQGYVSDDLSEAEVAELVEGEPYLTLTVETRAGKTTVYRYYPYSTRRAYYTVNGEGIFYALRDMVTKMVNDCENVMTDTPIDASAKG